MSATLAPSQDRRQLRRAETIQQLLDVAVHVMAEQGAAGLSLGEVARRMGVRPPSLYGYFPSKNAVCDAVFSRGWREVDETMRAFPEPDESTDLTAYLLGFAEVFVRWCVEHPVHAQLMIWRPVPGYEPSPEAYLSAQKAFATSRGRLAQLQQRGLFDEGVPLDDLMRAWTILASGIVTRQLANSPQESFDEGSCTTMLPQLVAMYQAHYAPLAPTTAPRRS